MLAPSIGTDETLSAALPCGIFGEILLRVRVRVSPLFGPEECTRWYTPEEHLESVVLLQKRMKL